MGLSAKNLLLFSVGCTACVFFAAQGRPTVSLAAVILVLTAHLLSAPVWRKEALTIGAFTVIGWCWESLLLSLSVLQYPDAGSEWFVFSLAPAWLAALWALLATTINRGLAGIKKSWALSSVTGAIFGLGIVGAGSAMGALTLSYGGISLLIVAAGWAILFPLLALLAESIIDATWLEPEEPLSRQPTQAATGNLRQLLLTLRGKTLDP